MAEDTQEVIVKGEPVEQETGTGDPERDRLLTEAASLDLKVDGRWTNATLQDKIKEAKDRKEAMADTRSDEDKRKEAIQAQISGNLRDPKDYEPQGDDEGSLPPKGAGEAFANRSHFPVKLLKGYYPEDGSEKLIAGTVAEVRVGEAKRMIEQGIAERADPLPSGL